MGGAGAARPGARAGPERHGREARVRAARDGGRAAVARGLGPPGRHVRRGGRPWTDRQGGARPAGGAPVARRARRRERPSPAGRERTGEHDLRVPARRPDVPGLDARAPRANRRPLVPDDGRGRVDPPGRRCGRGRGPRRGPARLREGSRGAGHRRRLDPGPAGADRRDARGRARALGHDAPVRPAPGDRDLGHAARGARAAVGGRAPAPDAGGGRRAARRRARAGRRARGVRPRLVRRAPSAGWARTATASCASRCAAGSSTAPGRRCSRAAASSPTPTRPPSGRSRASSSGRS